MIQGSKTPARLTDLRLGFIYHGLTALASVTFVACLAYLGEDSPTVSVPRQAGLRSRSEKTSRMKQLNHKVQHHGRGTLIKKTGMARTRREAEQSDQDSARLCCGELGLLRGPMLFATHLKHARSGQPAIRGADLFMRSPGGWGFPTICVGVRIRNTE